MSAAGFRAVTSFGRESTCLDPPASVALFGRNFTPQRAELSSPDARYPVQVITVLFPQGKSVGVVWIRCGRSSRLQIVWASSTRCGPSSLTALPRPISIRQRWKMRCSGARRTRWDIYSLFSAATMLYSLVNTIEQSSVVNVPCLFNSGRWYIAHACVYTMMTFAKAYRIDERLSLSH